VLIMDSLPAHKPKRVRDLIERRGCELLYLPGYSPDYNPIEEAFSKVKQILREAAARTRGALWWKRSAGHYARLALRMRGASLAMPATALRVNYCEMRCRKGAQPGKGRAGATEIPGSFLCPH
jgi:hypothetical protein